MSHGKVIDLYYGADGIGYTLGRVHIGSCDFSLKSYSFDVVPGDYSMNYFDTEVTHDNAQMLPLMRLAIDAAKAPLPGTTAARGIANGVNILASPWSPPSWMKRPVKGYQNMTGERERAVILRGPYRCMSNCCAAQCGAVMCYSAKCCVL
jgi:glucosylceramidase